MLVLACALIAAGNGHPWIAACLVMLQTFASPDLLAQCWQTICSLKREVSELTTTSTQEKQQRKSLEYALYAQQAQITSLRSDLSAMQSKKKSANKIKLSLSNLQ